MIEEEQRAKLKADEERARRILNSIEGLELRRIWRKASEAYDLWICKQMKDQAIDLQAELKAALAEIEPEPDTDS